MFLDSRDRLNRKGETARSLEDYRMSMIWWVFFRLRIWCFVPYSLPLIYFKVTSHLQKPKKSIFIVFDKTEFKHLTLSFTHSETVWFMEDLAVIITFNYSFLSEIISLSLGKNRNVIHQPKSVRVWKNCALCLEYRPRPTLALGHSFSQYGPPGWRITYLYCFENRISSPRE